MQDYVGSSVALGLFFNTCKSRGQTSSIRKGADLEKQNCLFDVHPEVMGKLNSNSTNGSPFGFFSTMRLVGRRVPLHVHN